MSGPFSVPDAFSWAPRGDWSFFEVLADSRAFGEDDAMARMRKQQSFADDLSNGSLDPEPS